MPVLRAELEGQARRHKLFALSRKTASVLLFPHRKSLLTLESAVLSGLCLWWRREVNLAAASALEAVTEGRGEELQ